MVASCILSLFYGFLSFISQSSCCKVLQHLSIFIYLLFLSTARIHDSVRFFFCNTTWFIAPASCVLPTARNRIPCLQLVNWALRRFWLDFWTHQTSSGLDWVYFFFVFYFYRPDRWLKAGIKTMGDTFELACLLRCPMEFPVPIEVRQWPNCITGRRTIQKSIDWDRLILGHGWCAVVAI